MKLISNIVFTKNRPLQLNGYLESLYRHLPPEQIRTYILWKQELFTREYEELFSRYTNCIVVREKDFSSDFFKILEKIDTKYILFGIDDVVYFDSVDFDAIDETFNKYDDVFGFSLRFGENVLNNGVDRAKKIDTDGQQVYKICWFEGRTKNTMYPFELCATIYRTELIRKIINSSRSHNHLAEKLLSPNSFLIMLLKKFHLARMVLKRLGFFYNPNTLESWVCKWCQQNADKLPSFIYFQKQCACAVQVNMVTITDKIFKEQCEGTTIQALNEKYKQGFRLDTNFVATNRPKDTHCGKEHFRLREQFI